MSDEKEALVEAVKRMQKVLVRGKQIRRPEGEETEATEETETE